MNSRIILKEEDIMERYQDNYADYTLYRILLSTDITVGEIRDFICSRFEYTHVLTEFYIDKIYLTIRVEHRLLD